MTSNDTNKTARLCAVCKEPIPRAAGRVTSVFCSARCRTVDLGKWLNGSYTIPACEPDDSDELGSPS